MENESPLPEAPPVPRIIPFKKAMAYSWAGLLVGAIFLVDGIFLATIFHFVMGPETHAVIRIGIPVAMAFPGLVMLLLALGRIGRRRRLLESGRAVRGTVLSCKIKMGWNPPPLVVLFETEDPMSGQPIQGKRWFMASQWSPGDGPMPTAGAPCLVVVDEGMGQQIELLAIDGWCAWSG